MKNAALVLSLALLLPATPALAHRHHHVSISGGRSGCCDSPAYWAHRCAPGGARFAITNENRSVDLLLDRREVVLQLSDRTMHHIDRELRDENGREDGFLADVIRSAVLGAVRDLLDHSLRCAMSDLRDADYRDGRLVLVTRDGDELFDHVDVEDHDVMESFSPADARAFVAEFRRLKGVRG